jgi:hypothetical protein
VTPGRTIICRRRDRLISRLQAVLWSWRFARKMDAELFVYWPTADSKVAEFDGPDFRFGNIISLADLYLKTGDRSIVVFDDNGPADFGCPHLDYDPTYAAMRTGGFDPKALFEASPIHHTSGARRFRNVSEKPRDVIPDLRALYRTLPLNPLVAEDLDEALGFINSEGFTVAHVRRGDVLHQLSKTIGAFDGAPERQAQFVKYLDHFIARISPLQNFYAETDKAVEAGEKVLLMSDGGEDVTRAFEKRYGAGKVVSIDKIGRRRRPIQKAFLDFNVMVRATKIVTTRSNFGRFAASLSGAPCLDVTLTSGHESVAELFSNEVLQTSDAPRQAKREALKLLQRQLDASPAAQPSTA